MQKEYLVETKNAKGEWRVVDSASSSGVAQGHMDEYRKAQPEQAVRVVEYPSGKIIAIHDPHS
jgi:hypothetical protein